MFTLAANSKYFSLYCNYFHFILVVRMTRWPYMMVIQTLNLSYGNYAVSNFKEVI